MAGRVAARLPPASLRSATTLERSAHVGYDHIDSLLPTVLAVAFFVLATRNRSPALMFIAGVLAGMCIYTNVAARVIFPTILVFASLQVFSQRPKTVGRWILPWVVGMAIAALPMLIVDGNELVPQMFGRVIGGQLEPSDLGTLDRVKTNIELNLFAFNFNEHISHYVSGSLFDPITASISVVGRWICLGQAAGCFVVIPHTLVGLRIRRNRCDQSLLAHGGHTFVPDGSTDRVDDRNICIPLRVAHRHQLFE